MVVELDNGQRFIANFRYNLKKSVSEDPLFDNKHRNLQKISTTNFDSFNSICSETMVGLVQTNDKKKSSMTSFPAQCFHAKQIKKFDIEMA